jgi:hypothetical protein
MAKDQQAPAFQCYARDAITTTSAYSLSETGAWAKLRWWTWMNGPLPLERLHLILGVPRTEAKRLWAVIGPHWHETERGWVAPDLESQRTSKKAFSAEQSAKGAIGAAIRWGKRGRTDGSGHSSGHASATQNELIPVADSSPGDSSALCTLHSADQTQIHEDQPLRGGPRPVENAENDNPRVLLRLAYDVLDEQAKGAFDPNDLEHVFERRAAKAGLNYAGDRTRKALESAQAGRAAGRRPR